MVIWRVDLRWFDVFLEIRGKYLYHQYSPSHPHPHPRMISGTALASFSLIIDPVDGWQIIIVIKRIESKNFVEV
jgi:hypothetical protein